MIYVTVQSEQGFDEYWVDESDFNFLTDCMLKMASRS